MLLETNPFMQVIGCRLWIFAFNLESVTCARFYLLCISYVNTQFFCIELCQQQQQQQQFIAKMRIHFSPPFISYFMCFTLRVELRVSSSSEPRGKARSMSRWSYDMQRVGRVDSVNDNFNFFSTFFSYFIFYAIKLHSLHLQMQN